MNKSYTILPKVSEPDIFLATPLGKDKKISAGTAMACALIDKRDDVSWGQIGTLSHELSRNSLIEDHLYHRGQWTHVLFIDSDIVPPADGLNKLLETEADVIAGICPILLDNGIYWNVTDDEDNFIPYNEPLPIVPFEVQSAGAGFILIRKDVLIKIGWPYFHMEYQPKYPDGAIKTGEDIYFCKKAKENGFKIIAHPEVLCKHPAEVELTEIYQTIASQIQTKYIPKEKA